MTLVEVGLQYFMHHQQVNHLLTPSTFSFQAAWHQPLAVIIFIFLFSQKNCRYKIHYVVIQDGRKWLPIHLFSLLLCCWSWSGSFVYFYHLHRSIKQVLCWQQEVYSFQIKTCKFRSGREIFFAILSYVSIFHTLISLFSGIYSITFSPSPNHFYALLIVS